MYICCQFLICKRQCHPALDWTSLSLLQVCHWSFFGIALNYTGSYQICGILFQVLECIFWEKKIFRKRIWLYQWGWSHLHEVPFWKYHIWQEQRVQEEGQQVAAVMTRITFITISIVHIIVHCPSASTSTNWHSERCRIKGLFKDHRLACAVKSSFTFCSHWVLLETE